MLRRSPLRRRTPLRSYATSPEVRDFERHVRSFAGGRCEARCSPDCIGVYQHAHHVVPRSRGQGWPWLHDALRNGLGVCARCHSWIHGHPADAGTLGLLRSRPLDDTDPGPLEWRH